MGKIFKNMLPYWKWILVIVALGANYDKEEYRQVTWDELMKECTPVEVIVCE